MLHKRNNFIKKNRVVKDNPYYLTIATFLSHFNSSGGIGEMNLYNVKLIRFGNGQIQIRRYQEPIVVNLLSEEEKEELKERRLRQMEEKQKLEHELSKRNPFSDARLTLVDEIRVLAEEELREKQERSVRSSLCRTINRLYELSRSNEWEWFLTFTFNESVNRYDYDECSRKLRQWLNNMQKRYSKDLKYLVVPEKHKSGAWHFHGLFSNMGNIKMAIAVNNDKGSPYYKDKLRVSYPDGDFIYNLQNYKYGFTTATKIKSTYKASNYIMKYISKDLCAVTKHKRRYFHSLGLSLPSKEIRLLEEKDFQIFLGQLVNEGYCLNYKKDIDIHCDGYINRISYFELALEEVS